jgi:hypothetical protein
MAMDGNLHALGGQVGADSNNGARHIVEMQALDVVNIGVVIVGSIKGHGG